MGPTCPAEFIARSGALATLMAVDIFLAGCSALVGSRLSLAGGFVARPADLFGLITAGLPVPKPTTEEQQESQASEHIRQAGHQARSSLRAIVDRADGVNGQVGGGERITVLAIAY